MKLILRALVVIACSALWCGCATNRQLEKSSSPINRSSLSLSNLKLAVPGFGPCTDNSDRTLELDSARPVTVLVHGCSGSAGRFRALAQVFAFQGQQAICFSYDDRESLTESAKQLSASLNHLSQQMQNKEVTVIGHSQGGLIARKALTVDIAGPKDRSNPTIRLATVSTPFAGIASANHCGSSTARILSLGIVPLICRAVTGRKWRDIPYSSDFIRHPGSLTGTVREYLKVVTDERDSCRSYDALGVCKTDDYVFSLDEQRFAPIDASDRISIADVKAGHVEIVGDSRVIPTKLIELLQHYGYLNSTLASQRASFDALLATLYQDSVSPPVAADH